MPNLEYTSETDRLLYPPVPFFGFLVGAVVSFMLWTVLISTVLLFR